MSGIGNDNQGIQQDAINLFNNILTTSKEKEPYNPLKNMSKTLDSTFKQLEGLEKHGFLKKIIFSILKIDIDNKNQTDAKREINKQIRTISSDILVIRQHVNNRGDKLSKPEITKAVINILENYNKEISNLMKLGNEKSYKINNSTLSNYQNDITTIISGLKGNMEIKK